MKPLLIAALISLSPVPAVAADPAPCLGDAWPVMLDPGLQNFEFREVFEHPNGSIFAMEFDTLAGPYAKLFVFFLDNGHCFTRAVSFGSYAQANAASDRPVFHADLYTTDSHATLGLYDQPPGFEDAKRVAMEAFQ